MYFFERLEDYFACRNIGEAENHLITYCGLKLFNEAQVEFVDIIRIVQRRVAEVHEAANVCLNGNDEDRAQCFVDTFVLFREVALEYINRVQQNRGAILSRLRPLLNSFFECRLDNESS